jgi:exosome complex component RRP42
MEAIDIVKTSYIKELIAKGTREDGRRMDEFRPIEIIPNLIKNAEGSAQVDLGATRVLAGVKLNLDEPMEDTPNQGNLVVSAELLPLASASYESGPPSPDSIELARVVDRGIRHGKCINLESLFVEESKAWTVYVDLYVLNYNGNLFDAGSMAAMSALLGTEIPKYEDGKVVREERVGRLKIDNIVTSSTFAKIDGKSLIDPTANETNAAYSRMTIATDGKYVRSMQKGLSGGFSAKEIDELVGAAFNNHKEQKSIIEKSQK